LSLEHATGRFARIGARLKVEPLGFRRAAAPGQPNYEIDVGHDRSGEYFQLRASRAVGLEVLDVAPELRHLLLLVRDGHHKEKYLCGHDERHWFVAGVSPSATCVGRALAALQPQAVAEKAKVVRPAKRLRRRCVAFVRQGEWFFVPAPDLTPPALQVLRNEPLRRNMRSKPHVCDEVYRTGGVQVYVCPGLPLGWVQFSEDELDRHAYGFTEDEREIYFRERPEARQWGWRVMARNPDVYVRGRVRHADHRTVILDLWHRVYLNNEQRSERFRFSVAFLD